MSKIILSKFKNYQILKARCRFINNDVYEGCVDGECYEGCIDNVYVENGYLVIRYYSIMFSEYSELNLSIKNMSIFSEEDYEDGSKLLTLATSEKCIHNKYNDKYEIIGTDEIEYDYWVELHKSANEKISLQFIFDCLCESEWGEKFLTKNLSELKDDTILKYLG